VQTFAGGLDPNSIKLRNVVPRVRRRNLMPPPKSLQSSLCEPFPQFNSFSLSLVSGYKYAGSSFPSRFLVCCPMVLMAALKSRFRSIQVLFTHLKPNRFLLSTLRSLSFSPLHSVSVRSLQQRTLDCGQVFAYVHHTSSSERCPVGRDHFHHRSVEVLDRGIRPPRCTPAC